MPSTKRTDAVLRDRARALRRASLTILDDMGVRALITDKLGCEPMVAGSVDLDLMTWPDIDLWVNLPPAQRHIFLLLGAELAGHFEEKACPVIRCVYRDEYRQPDSPIGDGLYWGLKFHHPAFASHPSLDKGDRIWKLDLWAWDRDYESRYHAYETLRGQLQTVDRLMVLRLKDRVCRRPDYRKEVISTDIYAFVQQEASDDLAAFDSWLATRREG